VDGDRNSCFFHQSATNRKRGCSILRIKDTSGIWIEELPAIKQKFLVDFSTRFTSARGTRSGVNGFLATPVVTAEENAGLIKPVTDEEIYTAVFQLDPHKAPGSDGFGGVFLSRSLGRY